MILKPRQKEFLEDYAITSNITKSAIKVGYSPMYADKLGKRIVNSAIKAKAKDIVERIENKPITKEEAKELLCEVIGIDRELLNGTLRKIALQDKDYSSAIKILSPLAKEALGLDLSNQDTPKTTVPILNVVVSKPDNEVNKGLNDNSEVKD